MVQPVWTHEASRKSNYVLALILSPGTAPNMSVYGPDHRFQGQWLDVVSCYFPFLHPVVGDLIVCSTRGFACILAKWFWPTVMSLSLTYGSPEGSCNKQADTYFGRRSASLMKEFWTLCILVMTVSETGMVETIPYSNIGLTHCL